MITNLTEGKSASVLIKFTLPMLVSIAFQQMYNIADSVIAGQFIGIDALAAIGASYPVTMIFMAIATGMNVGASVIISQLFGAGKHGDTKRAVNTSLFSAAVISLCLTVLGVSQSGNIIELLNTPAEILADSKIYLDVYTLGLVFLFIYNICTGIFTALGDSRTPLYFLVGSSVGNVALDIILVLLEPKVVSLALATLICQGAAAILSFICLFARIKKTLGPKKVGLFSAGIFSKIMLVSVPSMLQHSFVSVGNLFIQGLVNSFNSPAIIAGYSSAIKLNTFAVTSYSALGSSSSAFTAQNMGANKPERVKKGLVTSILLALCVASLFAVLYFFFGGTIASLFIDKGDAEYKAALAVSVQFLKIVSPFYLIISIKLVLDGLLRGAGSVFAFMASTFSDLILRVAISFALTPKFNETGIWLSWPIGWCVACGVSVLFYFFSNWQNKRMV